MLPGFMGNVGRPIQETTVSDGAKLHRPAALMRSIRSAVAHICPRLPRLASACLAAGVGLAIAACTDQSRPEAAGIAVAPTYNRDTGRLEKLTADQDGDGKQDTVAVMDGSRLKSIAIDRDNDGQADRWEYYEPAATGPGTTAFDRRALIVRADESATPGGRITRQEFYDKGTLQRVEQAGNLDGRVDKWEYYTNGVLSHVDLDLSGKGVPDRRLIYAANGDVVRVEQD